MALTQVKLAAMAANSVDSDQYVDGSIDLAHIANDSVDGNKLTDNIDIAGTLDVTGAATFDSSLGCQALTCSSIGTLNFADDVVANWGNTADGRIFYENSSNEFHVRTPGGTADLILGADVVKITNEDGNTDRLTINSTGVTGAGTATFSGLFTLDDTGANAGIQLGTGVDFTIKRSGLAAKFNVGADLDHYEFCVGGTEKISFNADGGLTCAGAATFTNTVKSLYYQAEQTDAANAVFLGRVGSSGSYTTIINANGTATFSGAVTAASFSGSGLGIADSCQWRLTSDLTGNQAPLTGWELADTYAGGGFGSAMTESSGIFTFPSTGWWLVVFHLQCNSPDSSQNVIGEIETTTDNSSYGSTAAARQGIYDMSASYNSHGSCTAQALVDVTSTTNVKVRFKYTAGQGTEIAKGSSSHSHTNVIFTRLGDT